jgi:hypothetical protein
VAAELEHGAPPPPDTATADDPPCRVMTDDDPLRFLGLRRDMRTRAGPLAHGRAATPVVAQGQSRDGRSSAAIITYFSSLRDSCDPHLPRTF